jgi:hypothetical protein
MEEGADAVGVVGVAAMVEHLSPKANLKLPIHKARSRKTDRRTARRHRPDPVVNIRVSRIAAPRIVVPVEAEGNSSVAKVATADPPILALQMPGSIRLPWITAIDRTCRTTTETDVVRQVDIRSKALRR